ncbi:MAG: uroporphyrinogen decarboxylase family protein [Eubacterium sp.]
MNQNEQLFSERVEIYKNAVSFKKPSRIPIHSNAFSSKVCETGYKLSEALFDYSIYKDVMRKYQSKYNPDSYQENGFRNPMRIVNALGGADYILDDDQNTLNFADASNTQLEDYPLIKENLGRYIFETFIPRKYKGITEEKLLNGLKETASLVQYLDEIDVIMKDEFGLPPFSQTPTTFLPFEYIVNGMRGLAGTSMDLRRQKESLKETMTALNNYFDPIGAMSRYPDGTSENTLFDNALVIIAHTILNPKQFEELYWPYLKEAVQYNADHGKKLFIFAEGSNERLYDFIQEFPKGTVALQLEMDDIFEAKKKIGDKVCLMGGFPHDLLIKGTPEVCRDYAKRLIEELGGAEGGYIFSTNKMLSFKSDVNEENLKAVHDFVRNYQL